MSIIELLKLLARVAAWKGAKDRAYFDEIVSPLYSSAEQVFNDYVRIFDHIISLLAEGQPGIEKSIAYLETERRRYQSERAKIREAIWLLQRRQSFSSKNFERGLEGILCAGVSQYEPRDHIDMAGFYKRNHTILGFLCDISQNEVPAHMLPDFCRSQAMRQLAALEEAFKTLTAGYYEIHERVVGL